MIPRWQKKEAGEGSEAVYRCGLCFRQCRIPAGLMGYCGVRGADEAGFVSPFLGRFCSAAVDPIEKKPLYHWRPGSRIFSLGGLGCTMRCPFCQNHTIAQPQTGGRVSLTDINPEELAARAAGLGLASVAYTYNEPTVQAEYILTAAPILSERGLATVLVTNGLMASEPLSELAPWVAAANVDVKTFNPETYARLGGCLEAVKNTVAALLAAGTHVEITTLVVPAISDDPDEFAALVDWAASLSSGLPIHISRYFPAFTYTAPPTELSILERFRDIAAAKLKHVHLGNVR